MSRENPEGANDKREGFIDKLSSLGIKVEEISRKPIVYRVNGRLVNVRSRDVPRVAPDGTRRFWYSLSTNVLEDVDLVIYLTTEPDYFVMIPSGFLANYVDKMSVANGQPATRVFDVDWDNLQLILNEGLRVDIDRFYCNLVHEVDYPQF